METIKGNGEVFRAAFNVAAEQLTSIAIAAHKAQQKTLLYSKCVAAPPPIAALGYIRCYIEALGSIYVYI